MTTTSQSLLDTLDPAALAVVQAPVSAQRQALAQDWLAGNPSHEACLALFKALSDHDHGAAKLIKARLDADKAQRQQDALVQLWQDKARALLGGNTLPVGDALAWLRDAAKAGAPLASSPLAQLKAALSEQAGALEKLQHRIHTLKEQALMLQQRMDLLTTQPLAGEGSSVAAGAELLAQDVAGWQSAAAEVQASAAWKQVEVTYKTTMEHAQTQLAALWAAFSDAWAKAQTAVQDAGVAVKELSLPPVWAKSIAQQRGEAVQAANALSDEENRAKQEQQQAQKALARAKAKQAQGAIVTLTTKLGEAVSEGKVKDAQLQANELRKQLTAHTADLPASVMAEAQAALAKAKELLDWQRWSADEVRADLIKKAAALAAEPLGGAKQQNAIRALRNAWKETDGGLGSSGEQWTAFDEACNKAYEPVKAWLDTIKAKEAGVREVRSKLAADLQAWTASHTAAVAAASVDWRSAQYELNAFEKQWREAGHLGEKEFKKLDDAWRELLKAAKAPAQAARNAEFELRKDLIAKAHALFEGKTLRDRRDVPLGAVKDLQSQWQQRAKTFALDRHVEQKLWTQFKKPIDDAFAALDAAKATQHAAQSEHDARVMQAAQAVQTAVATQDASAIKTAMAALEVAQRARDEKPPVDAAAPAAVPAAVSVDVDTKAAVSLVVPAVATDAVTNTDAAEAAVQGVDENAAETSEVAQVVEAAAPVKTSKPVVAVRGDDRQKSAPPASKFGAGKSFGDKKGGDKFGRNATGERSSADRNSGDRSNQDYRDSRGPRLSDQAFDAVRAAKASAEKQLYELQNQAHGEVLMQVVHAWRSADAALMPAAKELTKLVPNADIAQWREALAKKSANGADTAQPLLRLELQLNLPSPAPELAARKLLQLQLLSQKMKRDALTPAQQLQADMTAVLSGPADDAKAARVLAVLKAMGRKPG